MASADNLCLSLFTSLHRCARTGKLALLSAIVVTSVLLVRVDGRAQSGERDLVEFMTGRKLTGKVKAIRKMEKEFDFTYELSGREFTRTFKFSSVRAVTMDGNRHVLTKESATAVESATGGKLKRSKSQIDRLIADAVATKPDWFDSTPVNFPRSLDMNWPMFVVLVGAFSERNAAWLAIGAGRSCGTLSVARFVLRRFRARLHATAVLVQVCLPERRGLLVGQSVSSYRT